MEFIFIFSYRGVSESPLPPFKGGPTGSGSEAQKNAPRAEPD